MRCVPTRRAGDRTAALGGRLGTCVIPSGSPCKGPSDVAGMSERPHWTPDDIPCRWMSAELTGVTNVDTELQNVSLTAHMPRHDEQYVPIASTSCDTTIAVKSSGHARP